MEEKTPAGCTGDGRRHGGCRQLAEVLAEKIGMPQRITVECAMDGQGDDLMRVCSWFSRPCKGGGGVIC